MPYHRHCSHDLVIRHDSDVPHDIGDRWVDGPHVVIVRRVHAGDSDGLGPPTTTQSNAKEAPALLTAGGRWLSTVLAWLLWSSREQPSFACGTCS